MKYIIIIVLAGLVAGCTTSKIPGVLDAQNFFFNQKFSKLGTSTSQASTNGVTTNMTLYVEGFVSDATENLKIAVEGLKAIAAAAAAGGTGGLAGPMMLMTPLTTDIGVGSLNGAQRAPGSPQSYPQPIYLVPIGRSAPVAPTIFGAPTILSSPTPPPAVPVPQHP